MKAKPNKGGSNPLKSVVKNDHGLLLHDKGVFGHLVHFAGHGVFDPDSGRVNVAPSLVDTHNRVLDQAFLDGLDNNCEIGLGGFFYHGTTGEGRHEVKTFTGMPVSRDVTLNGRTITFRRNGMVFRGRLCRDAESFRFRRVA